MKTPPRNIQRFYQVVKIENFQYYKGFVVVFFIFAQSID